MSRLGVWIRPLLFLGLIGAFHCFPTTDWSEDICSRRPVIKVQTLQGHINSFDAKLNMSDDCQMWAIFVQPNKTITIRFSYFMSDGMSCNEGAYVEMGPAPVSTLCGVPKIPFTYHSTRDHAWIKFVIPKTARTNDAFFMADFISELGASCTARCTDGTCIRSEWRCNGNVECLDHSDEMNCPRTHASTTHNKIILEKVTTTTTTTRPVTSASSVRPHNKCGENNLHCLTRYFVYGCLPVDKLCDGSTDCLNGQDEQNCIMNSTEPTVMANPCEYGEIYCKIHGEGNIYRCLHNIHKCDGITDCSDNQDENPAICRHEKCDRRLEEASGWFSPPYWSNQCSWVIHQLGSSPKKSKIQLRPVLFTLDPSTVDLEYVKVYDGADATYPLIGRYDGLNPPPHLIESSSNWLHVMYHLTEGNKMAFNFTYQIKGFCLHTQLKCSKENDCYEMTQRCNGIWDCPVSGSDELGCGHCFNTDYFCGSQTGQCYHKEERCNGITRCSSKVDEINCSPVQCGPHNGTFLCDNSHCIYESWVCDQRDDCGDNSDERNCGGSTKRVIIAAISGSMTCALLLVILMGCSCKLYSLRVVDHRRIPRHETPMSRLYAEFLRRRAPPPYHEAMLTSRNFDEVQQEFLERSRHASNNRTRRSRRSRSRNGQQQSQDGDTGPVNDGEQRVNAENLQNTRSSDDGPENAEGTSNGESSPTNVNIDRTSSTAELLPSDSQTGSSDSEDSDVSGNEGSNPDDENRDNSDDENILTSQTLSARWERATDTEMLSDEECILERVSERESHDEPLTFSSSFRDSHCDSASVDTAGTVSINSIELPEITPTSSTIPREIPTNGDDSDLDKLDEDDVSIDSTPKPETFISRSVISDQLRLSQDSLNSEGSENFSDNDVPLVQLHNSVR